MAKKKKPSPPSISALAANANTYRSRTKMYWDDYEDMRAIVTEFAEGRDLPATDPRHHKRGLRWLLKTGMYQLNSHREAAGLPPILHDLSENSVLRWIDAELPERLSKHFHR